MDIDVTGNIYDAPQSGTRLAKAFEHVGFGVKGPPLTMRGAGDELQEEPVRRGVSPDLA